MKSLKHRKYFMPRRLYDLVNYSDVLTKAPFNKLSREDWRDVLHHLNAHEIERQMFGFNDKGHMVKCLGDNNTERFWFYDMARDYIDENNNGELIAEAEMPLFKRAMDFVDEVTERYEPFDAKYDLCDNIMLDLRLKSIQVPEDEGFRYLIYVMKHLIAGRIQPSYDKFTRKFRKGVEKEPELFGDFIQAYENSVQLAEPDWTPENVRARTLENIATCAIVADNGIDKLTLVIAQQGSAQGVIESFYSDETIYGPAMKLFADYVAKNKSYADIIPGLTNPSNHGEC